MWVPDPTTKETTLTTTIASPPDLRSSDVAALLDCTAGHVRSLALRGMLPFSTDEQGRLFQRDDVDAFIRKRETDDRDLMTFAEAARILGYANTSSVTHLVERGVLQKRTYRRVAKRVARADVEALLATRGGPVRRGGKAKG